MEIVGITKPIKCISLTSTYIKGSNYYNGYYKYEAVETPTIYGVNPTDVIDFSTTPRKLQPEQFGTLTDSATLYFDKSATFPRYKLEGTNYKRCIKIEKADFIIVDKNVKPTYSYSILHIYEDNDYVYIVSSYDNNRITEAFKNSGYNVSYIKGGRAYIYNQSAQILLMNPSKPLISDEDLTKKIDENISPVMTLDDAKQIITMLNSTDLTVVDLGLKLLAGFSVSATPFSLKTILLTNKRWTSTNARTSVGVKAMLTALKVDRYQAESRFPYNIDHLNDGQTYSEEDLKMGRSLLKTSIENYINSALAREIEIFEGPNVGFKVDISVSEK